MPDYTSILRRSISALPDSRLEMREAVYQRARAALARQLTAVDPPLSTREIERQHQDLEDAVARLEADFSQSPDAAPAKEASRDTAFSYIPAQPQPAPYSKPDTAVLPSREARTEAPDRDYDGEEEDDDEEFEDAERGSRIPLLIGALLVVLVVGGMAAFVYARSDAIAAYLGFADGGEIEATGEAGSPADIPAAVAGRPTSDTPPETDSDKRPDRLTNGGDAPPDEAPLPSGSESGSPEIATDLPLGGETPAEPLPSETVPAPAEQETAALQPQPEPELPPGQSIVAQRAIYYFQGAEGQPGRATEGTVAWAEITRDNGPAVQATLTMAGQDVTTTVTIYKNTDGTLPASHLVEVQFSGEIGPTPVQRVPAVVMKQTEQARGQPLAGAAVPVTGELFWIALSNDEQQVSRNLQLLREGSWFDLPILFNDGTRALLTFEKGIPGDKVFETVMSSWTPS